MKRTSTPSNRAASGKFVAQCFQDSRGPRPSKIASVLRSRPRVVSALLARPSAALSNSDAVDGRQRLAEFCSTIRVSALVPVFLSPNILTEADPISPAEIDAQQLVETLIMGRKEAVQFVEARDCPVVVFSGIQHSGIPQFSFAQAEKLERLVI